MKTSVQSSIVAAALLLAASSSSHAVVAYGLTPTGLLQFDTASPGSIQLRALQWTDRR